ncbi:MAG: hypothetical protein O7D91_21420 [Planctomycetota bacterium]|nr:hypothetical protein [Planctomycetota bacterium]
MKLVRRYHIRSYVVIPMCLLAGVFFFCSVSSVATPGGSPVAAAVHALSFVVSLATALIAELIGKILDDD